MIAEEAEEEEGEAHIHRQVTYVSGVHVRRLLRESCRSRILASSELQVEWAEGKLKKTVILFQFK